MKNFVRFTDFFTAKHFVIQDDEEKKDFGFLFGNPSSRRYRATSENLNGIPQVLGVKIAATHSGKVTGNNGFYLPDKMQSGVGSWLLPFPKPILLHHEHDDDAIGRVEEARYVDISNGFKQDFVKRKDKIFGNTPSDNLIDAFLKGELSPRECIDVVNNVFLIKDFNFTKDPSYPGLGYIELIASISEPDSIRKIMDKRFLTGSIGARTDAAICSICKKDWATEDEICEHRPGKEYKGVLCVLIAGNLMYDEYSYVNRPADVHSKTIEIFQNNEIKNSLNLGNWVDSIPEVGFNIVDSLTIFNKEPIMTLEKVIELLNKFLADSFSEILSFVDVQKLAQKFFDKHGSEITEEQLTEEFKQQLNRYNLLFEDAEDLLGQDPTVEDYLYVDMLVDARLGRLDMTDEEVKALLDAKLSSKTRKGMASSSFCGPNRSFPVPDCAHVTAARRLIGRYKGPGNKQSILSCVARKAKRMGCDTSKGDSQDDNIGVGQFTIDYFDSFEDKEILQMMNGIELVLDERELSNPCGCSEVKNKISTLENENKELKNSLSSFEETKLELKSITEDNKNMKDELLKVNTLLKDNHIDNVLLVKRLNGEEITDETRKELSEKTITDLVDIQNSLDENTKKVCDMLKLGMSRKPDGTISDPTLKNNDGTLEDNSSNSNIEKEIKITKDYMLQIQQNYLTIRMRDGSEAADAYLNALKASGHLPLDINGIIG